MNELIDKIDEMIKVILRDFPKTQAIYLYGSVARGEQQPDSDIDLAVLLPREQARSVGSLTMRQTQIAGTGQLIYEQDEFARQEFEMTALSVFQDLNRMRSDIVDSYLSSRNIPRTTLAVREVDSE